MPRYFLPLLAAAALHAGVMDFRTINDAEQAYADKQYEKAAKLYSTLAGKNDEARFDYATSLYRSKQFKPALDEYAKIPEGSALKAQALYNAGNAHAQLGELDQAEQAYDSALKIAKDEALKKDAEHNLEVIKQEKQKKKQQQNKDQDKQKRNDQNQQDKKNGQNQKAQDQDQKNDQQSSRNKDEDQKQNQNDKERQSGQKQDNRQDQGQQNSNDADKQNRESSEQDDQRKSPRQGQEQDQKEQQGQNSSAPSEEEKRQDAGAEEKEQKAQQTQAAMAEPISDMEERKYNQMLERRGIKTLMIPLSGKGEAHENETTPW